MRDAILEWGEIEVELGAASKAPEKVGIDGGEMVEEPFAIGELVAAFQLPPNLIGDSLSGSAFQLCF